MGWPDTAVEQLKTLWAAKNSITDIASIMGRTRSQIGGKLFRLGLTDSHRNLRNPKVKKAAQARAAAIREAHRVETVERRQRAAA